MSTEPRAPADAPRYPILLLGLVLIACGASKQQPAPQSSQPQPAPQSSKLPPPRCTNPERAQFDFWLGSWTVRDPKGKLAGRNTVTKTHRGCVVTERWTSARGGAGTSTNVWHPVKRKWVQHWVDGTGGIIDLEGNLAGASMVLAGTYVQADGKTSLLRGTWTPLPDGRVRQLFEESKDGGKTWSVWFDGYYSRTRPTSGR